MCFCVRVWRLMEWVTVMLHFYVDYIVAVLRQYVAARIYLKRERLVKDRTQRLPVDFRLELLLLVGQ